MDRIGFFNNCLSVRTHILYVVKHMSYQQGCNSRICYNEYGVGR